MGRPIILSTQQLQAILTTPLGNELLELIDRLDLAALVLESKLATWRGTSPQTMHTRMTFEEIQSVNHYLTIHRLDLAVEILEKKYAQLQQHVATQIDTQLMDSEITLLNSCLIPLYDIPDLRTQPDIVRVQIEERQRNVRELRHRLETFSQDDRG